MSTLVIGGGVVGLAVARSLAQLGETVTVAEAATIGSGASPGNGGWVSPSLAAPLPAPGVVRQALRWVVTRDAPGGVQPSLRPELLRWCWQFRRNCTPQRFEAGMRALLSINARAVELQDELGAEGGGEQLELRHDGLLYVARTRAGLDHYAHTLHTLRSLGYEHETERLDGPAVRRLEPTLAVDVVGGIHARGDATVRPERFVAVLGEQVRRLGVTLLERRRVVALERDHGGWVGVGPDGELRAERVVLAGGSDLAALARTLGVRLPLLPAKGHSVTGAGTGERPRHALYLTEALMGATPFAGALRIVGDFRLGAGDTHVAPAAGERLVRRFAPYVPGWRPTGCVTWSGLRPFVPDGLPLIGPLPGRPGAFVAGGHGMLGVTLALPTGEALARSMLDGAPDPALAAFDPGRFGRSAAARDRGAPRIGGRLHA